MFRGRVAGYFVRTPSGLDDVPVNSHSTIPERTTQAAATFIPA